MKITINKDTITIAKAQEAKEFAAENRDWIDADTIKNAVSALLEKHYGQVTPVEDIVKLPALEVTIDHYTQMSIYAHSAMVTYWHKDSDNDKTGFKVAEVSMNLTDYLSGNIHGFIMVYTNTFQGVI